MARFAPPPWIALAEVVGRPKLLKIGLAKRCLAKRCLASIGLAVFGLATLGAGGCNNGDVAVEDSDAATEIASTSAVQPAAFRERSPQQYLQAVLQRYRNTASYHDRGIVRLSYRNGNQQDSRTAPIQVWLDHDQLYVSAYDVRIWRDDRHIHCWIQDSATQNFDSQVVRQPVSTTRPTLKGLLSDPILADRIAAGLAGPPPQLEWLFANDPMGPLFDGTHEFRFAAAEKIAGVACQIVAVDNEYFFWIDQRNSTIRRVQLPSLRAPVNPGETPQAMSLSIELAGATFTADRTALKIDPLPSQPKFVRRFVPLPPPAPPAMIGQQADAFTAVVRPGGWTMSHRGSDRELTVVVGHGGNVESHATLLAMDRWQASMPADLRNRMRIVGLTNATGDPPVPEGLRMSMVPDSGQQIAKRFGIESGGVVILNSRGTVAWFQPAWSSAGSAPLMTLGAVSADLLAGVDVPRRMKQQWQEQRQSYQAAIQKEAIQDNVPSPVQ